MAEPDSLEIAGILWLAERDFPYREEATDSILHYFVAELPETAKMVNCGAIVDHFCTEAEAEPPEGVYRHYQGQLNFLVDMGLLQVHEDEAWKEEDEKGNEATIKVYSLSKQAMLIYKATRRRDGHDA